jgi:serine/threonine protein kinase
VPSLPDPLPSALADRYRIERQLGRGGMATVFLARDLRHDREVALKVLHPELAHALGPERFQREVRLAARLQHPLPFQNLGDSTQEYFADGITDAVRGKLSSLPGVRVIAGGSVQVYKDSLGHRPSAIGHRLSACLWAEPISR